MRALITGFGGFVAGYLARYLKCEKYEVICAVYPPMFDEEIQVEGRKMEVVLVPCDLTKRTQVEKILKDNAPDEIYHLAAQSHVPTAWKKPRMTFETNLFSTLNIFTSVLSLKLNPRILIVGSSEEYGECSIEDMPLKETSPLRPTNPYAVSKVAQDFLAYQYAKTGKINIVRVRSFSHTGPGQTPKFVCPNFTKQVAEIELELKEPLIKVGNLKPKRDFLDVRDVVRAYHLALKKGISGEVYNIASGKPHSIREILKICLSFSSKKIRVEAAPELFRPVDIPFLQGDSSLFRKITNWKPLIPFKQTLYDLYHYWICTLSNKSYKD